ncbi:MAG: GNAT family protein [Patescibacteria group bacterium]|nr:GNAT family protein [Patescibacteria group bacterium]
MIYYDDYWLRPIETTDLRWCKQLRNDAETWPFLGTFVLLDEFKQEAWLKKVSLDNSQEFLIFGKARKKIGYVRLTEIDRINRSVCVGGDILPRERGKGHAKMMFKLIFQLGFKQWPMHRLWLLVMETNKAAVNLYQKLGFKLEGKQREAIFRDGKYINYLMMSILKDEAGELID